MLKSVEKDIEALGGPVVVSEMGALDRIEYFESVKAWKEAGDSDQKVGIKLGALLVVKCLTKDGRRVYTDTQFDEVARSHNIETLNEFFTVAAELNGLLPKQQEAVAGN